jgi:hypothetical protein
MRQSRIQHVNKTHRFQNTVCLFIVFGLVTIFQRRHIRTTCTHHHITILKKHCQKLQQFFPFMFIYFLMIYIIKIFSDGVTEIRQTRTYIHCLYFTVQILIMAFRFRFYCYLFYDIDIMKSHNQFAYNTTKSWKWLKFLFVYFVDIRRLYSMVHIIVFFCENFSIFFLSKQ